jgi:hypothetical protein
VSIPADGQLHGIAYYSTDTAGNQEYIKWCPAVALSSVVAKRPNRGQLRR